MYSKAAPSSNYHAMKQLSSGERLKHMNIPGLGTRPCVVSHIGPLTPKQESSCYEGGLCGSSVNLEVVVGGGGNAPNP